MDAEEGAAQSVEDKPVSVSALETDEATEDDTEAKQVTEEIPPSGPAEALDTGTGSDAGQAIGDARVAPLEPEIDAPGATADDLEPAIEVEGDEQGEETAVAPEEGAAPSVDDEPVSDSALKSDQTLETDEATEDETEAEQVTEENSPSGPAEALDTGTGPESGHAIDDAPTERIASCALRRLGYSVPAHAGSKP